MFRVANLSNLDFSKPDFSTKEEPEEVVPGSGVLWSDIIPDTDVQHIEVSVYFRSLSSNLMLHTV